MNSIKKGLKADKSKEKGSIITTIKLKLNSEETKGKTLVIVEGSDDKKMYQKLLRDFYVSYYPADGCLFFIDILKALTPLYPDRFIIIKDADFDHLMNVSYSQYDNFFLTDTHDLETLIISKENFVALLRQEYQGGYINDVFLNELMQELSPLSYLRWYNYCNDLKLNFKKTVKAANLYKESGEVSTFEDWLNRLYSKDNNAGKTKILKQEIEDFKNNFPCNDMFNLSRGHDLCSTIPCKLKRNGYRSHISKKNFSKFVFETYTFKDFEKTTLYQKLLRWSETKHILLFKHQEAS